MFLLIFPFVPPQSPHNQWRMTFSLGQPSRKNLHLKARRMGMPLPFLFPYVKLDSRLPLLDWAVNWNRTSYPVIWPSDNRNRCWSKSIFSFKIPNFRHSWRHKDSATPFFFLSPEAPQIRSVWTFYNAWPFPPSSRAGKLIGIRSCPFLFEGRIKKAEGLSSFYNSLIVCSRRHIYCTLNLSSRLSSKRK